MSILLGLLLSLPSFANQPQPPTCEVLLEVFDQDVKPPFAHATHLMQILAAHPEHMVTKRDGTEFYIRTAKLNELLKLIASHDVHVTRVEKDGRSIPLYHAAAVTDVAIAERITLYQALAQLPEGLYWLTGLNTRAIATMFVEHETVVKGLGRQEHALHISIWPGLHRFPQTESKFGQRNLGTFTSGPAADSSRVEFKGDELILSYSLPYGYGSDRMTFKTSETQPFRMVTTGAGHSYSLFQFYPLKLRATGK